MESNWGRKPGVATSSGDFFRPRVAAIPRSYGRMPGYDGDPGPMSPPSARGARVANRWASAPATYTLVGINCARLPWPWSSGGYLPAARVVLDLVHWGANFWRFTFLAGQWWRLLTARVLCNVGILHLATNMWCLLESWVAGRAPPRTVGRGCRLCPYLGLLEIYSARLSIRKIVCAQARPGAGFFWPCGACLFFAVEGQTVAGSPLRKFGGLRKERNSTFALFEPSSLGARRWFCAPASRIDNMAHLGGFLCGLALGAPPGAEDRIRREINMPFRSLGWPTVG